MAGRHRCSKVVRVGEIGGIDTEREGLIGGIVTGRHRCSKGGSRG